MYFEGGPPGQMSAMFFFLMRPYWIPKLLFAVKYFYKLSFGGRNVRAYLLMGIRFETIEYRETSHALSSKEKTSLKLEWEKCRKIEVFLT